MAKLKQSSVAVSIVTLGGTVLEHHVTAGMKVGGLAQKVAASLNTRRDQIDLLQEDEGSHAGSRSFDGTEPALPQMWRDVSFVSACICDNPAADLVQILSLEALPQTGCSPSDH